MIREASKINEHITWQELTTGCEIYEPATSVLTKTGEWRSVKPVWLKEKCKQCLLCTPYCPDSSIPVCEGKRDNFDYEHCKGCGICREVCPFDAIEMQEESK